MRDGEGPSEEPEAPEARSWQQLALDCTIVTALLGFFGLYVYALSAANNAAVRQACTMLWEFTLTRLCTATAMCCAMLYVMCVPAARGSWSPQWTILLWGGMLTYFSAFTVAAGFIVSAAMVGNSACTAALSAASVTGTPLLGILGWVWLTLDGLYALMLLIMGCISGYHELFSDEEQVPPL